MEERVVTVKIDATVAGKKIDVCGANIVLGVNEIPRIELIVPPTRSKNSTPLKPNVFKPKLSDYADLYQTLSGYAEEQSKTGDVSIEVVTKDTHNNTKTDKVSLKEWILSGVGLSSIGASAAPHLSIILHHPAFWLTKVGSIYETPKTNSEKAIAEAAAPGESLLDIADKVYSAYRNDAAVEFFESPNSAMAAVYRNSLGVNEFNPRTYISEKNAKRLFLEQYLENYRDRIAVAIGRLVCPMEDGSSTWDMIVRCSGYLLLDIVQDEQNNFTMEQGLVLEPSKPWRTDKIITVSEDSCFSTDIPGMDMFKLVGVMARKLAIFHNRLTTWANAVSKRPIDDSCMCDVLYCPTDAPPKKADGRIMKTSAPVVLQQIAMNNPVYNGNIVTGEVDADKTLLTNFDKALYFYCKALFERSYGSMNSGSVQMALGFHDSSGKWILPGNTLKFMSEGKPIYYGYIRNVVHSMSTNGGCFTSIKMSHVRSKATVEKVPDGNKNAAYD